MKSSAYLRALLSSSLVVLLLSVSLVARAQNAGDKAAAEALFQEGKSLMEAAEYEKACPKLEASQSIDPGIGTLLYLAECYAETNKTASAWATFKEAASRARAQGQPERQQIAEQRADELAAQLSKLIVRVAPEAKEIEGLKISLNGIMVSQPSWGTPVPVDSGVQTIEASAPGYESWKTEVEVLSTPGETTVDVPALLPLATEPEPPAVTTPAPLPEPGPEDAGVARSGPGKTLGYVVGGVGVAGLALGSVFGLRAISKNDESLENCSSATVCTEFGDELRNDAFNAATLSTISFVAGSALVAAGVVFIVLSDSSGQGDQAGDASHSLALRTQVSGNGGSLSLKGAF